MCDDKLLLSWKRIIRPLIKAVVRVADTACRWVQGFHRTPMGALGDLRLPSPSPGATSNHTVHLPATWPCFPSLELCTHNIAMVSMARVQAETQAGTHTQTRTHVHMTAWQPMSYVVGCLDSHQRHSPPFWVWRPSWANIDQSIKRDMMHHNLAI